MDTIDAQKAAEAEVLRAALAYAESWEAYSQAFERNRDMDGYVGSQRVVPLHPETQELCLAQCERSDDLARAARALGEVVRGQKAPAVSP